MPDSYFVSIYKKIKTSDIATRFTSGAMWSILGNISGRGLVLLSFIIVARLIGQENYGKFSIIRSTIMMFSIFSGAGLGLTASRYIASYRNKYPEKTYEIYLLSRYLSIGLGFLIALILCIFAPIIADKSLNTPELTNDIRYASIVLLFITISSIQTGVLQGYEQFKIIAINTILLGIFQLLLLSFGAYFFNMKGIIFGMGISYLFLCLINQIFINRNITRTIPEEYRVRKIQKNTASILWKFSLPAVMSSVLVIPVIWWCKTMLVKSFGYEAAANYDVAEQWSMIILFIPATLSGMIIPLLSNVLSEGTSMQFKRLTNINLVINASIAIVFSIFIFLLASFILRLYGASFNDTRTFSLLILSTIPNAIASVLGNVIASKEKMWMGFILNAIWAVWLVSFFYLFTIHLGFGAFGFALAMLVAYILHTIFSYAYMWAKIMNKNEMIKGTINSI